MVKEEKAKLVAKTLLLTGLFAGLFVGVNMAVFSGAVVARIPAIMEQDGPGENRLLTETADENHGRDWSSFNVDRLVSMEDHFLTREEAEVIVEEALYERLGLEVDASEFTFGLLDHPHSSIEAIWITMTLGYDENGLVHWININAATGELLRLDSSEVSVEFFETYTHNGIDFVVEEWGRPHEGPEYAQYIRPYMIGQEEAVLMAADLIYETFGVTMEGLRMQASLGIALDTDRGFWNVHIMPVGYDIDEYGYISPAQWFYVFIDATTREVVHFQDFRDLDRNDIIIGGPEGAVE